jgi:hypothetical protein
MERYSMHVALSTPPLTIRVNGIAGEQPTYYYVYCEARPVSEEARPLNHRSGRKEALFFSFSGSVASKGEARSVLDTLPVAREGDAPSGPASELAPGLPPGR